MVITNPGERDALATVGFASPLFGAAGPANCKTMGVRFFKAL